MATILCIDDEPSVAAVLERALTEIGHDPVLVPSLDEALRALHRQPFDLVISEYQLPPGTALGLLETLRQQEIEVPVIILTGYSSIEDAVLSMRHGALDYLTKPLRAEALRLAVSHALEVTRLRRENGDLRREIGSLRGQLVAAPVPAAAPAAGEAPASASIDLPHDLRELERRAIRRALLATQGHRSRAAELLGISERTLRNKLNESPELAVPTRRAPRA